MTRLYQSVWKPTPKLEAQEHLCGRTHYVDDDTLRFHHAKILDCGISDNGLLCWLIESVSLDMRNTQRGFRYVVFDVFGNVISRVDLENSYKTSKAALKACREYLATVDAKAITKQAILDRKKQDAREYSYLEEQLKAIA